MVRRLASLPGNSRTLDPSLLNAFGSAKVVGPNVFLPKNRFTYPTLTPAV